jgi:hypothetical protein
VQRGNNELVGRNNERNRGREDWLNRILFAWMSLRSYYILTMVTLESSRYFVHVMLYYLVEVCQRFGEKYCLHLQGLNVSWASEQSKSFTCCCLVT